VVDIHRPHSGIGISFALCEECGRDLANAVGFLCVRDGGWSKIEPRKRQAVQRMDQAIGVLTRKPRP
jgi:hypothetical protein